MPLFRNLKGTTENSFQLGIGADVPILQRIADTARLQLPNLLRFLPGGSAIQGWIKSDPAGDVTVVKSEFNKTVPPTVNDDYATGGYTVGSRWIDTTNNYEYVCLDDSTGAAIWKNTTVSGAGSGDVVGPNSSIDWGMVVFDGTSGKLIQDSGKRNYGGSATDPTSPTPSDGDIYYNTVLSMWMFYDPLRSKFLSIAEAQLYFGRLGNTAPGSYFRAPTLTPYSDVDGRYAEYNGTVVSLEYTRGDSDSVTFEITADGTGIATVASTTTSGKTISLNGNFSANQVLGVRNQSGGNAVSDVVGTVRIRWRV